MKISFRPVAIVTAMLFLMLATLGIFELVAGHVTAGILMAVVIEVGLAVALLRTGLVLIEEGNQK